MKMSLKFESIKELSTENIGSGNTTEVVNKVLNNLYEVEALLIESSSDIHPVDRTSYGAIIRMQYSVDYLIEDLQKIKNAEVTENA